MADVTDINPELEELTADVDKLEAALRPLIDDLGSVSSKLPLLDKAKLNVLTCYAIESLLFSSLRLNGVEVGKDHAVMTELTRIRQYFTKISNIENPPAPAGERENTVNTGAAIRFIRKDLSDNKEVKDKLTEQLIKEGAKQAELQEKKKAERKRQAEEESMTSQSEAAAEGGGKKAKRNKSRR